MTPEFINAFIQRQKNLINELQAKLLLSETQYEISNNLNSTLQQENNQLKEQVEKLQARKTKAGVSE